MSPRERLTHRRSHETIDLEHGQFSYKAGVGRFEDGRIAEVFLTAAKSGTVIESWARDSAIIASLALQHGVRVDTLRHALSRDESGRPSTPLALLLDLLAEGADGR